MLKKLFWFIFILFILPTLLLVAVFKLAATPIINFLLQSYINAPAKVEKVNVNWLLTNLQVENLQIFQPKAFGKGEMLSIKEVEIKTIPTLTPPLFLTAHIKVKDLYLHYKEINGLSNLSLAFNIPTNSTGEGNTEFELKKVYANSTLFSLKDITYTVNGWFYGFHNNARFSINGTADLSIPQKLQAVADFTVYNWVLRNKYIQALTGQNEIELIKIDGRVKLDYPQVVFVEKNTKGYTLGNLLFVEIYKGSKYNLITKKMDIKGALYLPNKVEFAISGTPNSPKIVFKNLPELKIDIKTSEETQKTLKKLEKAIEKPLKNLLENLLK